MNVRVLGAIVLLAFHAISCQEKGSEQEEKKEYTITNGAIHLDRQSPIWNQLKFDTLQVKEVKQSWQSVGTVQIIPANNAVVSSPFSGRIIDSYVNVGQKVEKGQALFSFHSTDFYAAQKELADSKIEYNQAKIQLERQQDLTEKGVGVQRELEEAEALFSIASSAYENSKAFFKIFGSDGQGSEIGEALTIYSPISGEVIKNQISIGQYMKEDDEPLLQIANLEKLWVEAQVKEKDFAILDQIDEATITVDAYPEDKITGTVKYINEVIDEDTRSIKILIEAQNTNKHLKPGMFVNVKFRSVQQARLVVPNTAILQSSDNQYIFVRNEDDEFKKIEVKTESDDNERYSLISGDLAEGDVYITEGGIYLASLK